MPGIGNPNIVGPNSFNSIKMGPKVNPAAVKAESVGDTLNKVSGNNKNSGLQYVNKDKHNQMGKDEFLRLLTVQLQNQDPFKPVDQKKFAADLAQFASLEQLTGVKQNIEKMANKNVDTSKFHGAGFLGKTAITSGTTLDHKENGTSIVPFSLSKDAKAVIVRIFDKKGQNVGQVSLENLSKGSNQVVWDGKQIDGRDAPQGRYTVKVFAWDKNMLNFNGETKTKGVVTGVNFEDGETILNIDNKRKVFLRDVDSFLMTKDSNLNVNKPDMNKATEVFAKNQEGIQ